MADSVLAIEAEIAATRARLDDTIDRIQRKLTVSGIVDEVMGQAGVPGEEAGHSFVAGLFRRHPIPVLIAAAGLGYVFYRMNRPRPRALDEIADADFVDVPAVNDGQARIYDPDLPARHPSPEARRSIEAQA